MSVTSKHTQLVGFRLEQVRLLICGRWLIDRWRDGAIVALGRGWGTGWYVGQRHVPMGHIVQEPTQNADSAT